MKEIVETKIGLEEARIRYAELRSIYEEQKDSLDSNSKKQIIHDMLVQVQIISDLDESRSLNENLNLILAQASLEDALESVSKGGIKPWPFY